MGPSRVGWGELVAIARALNTAVPRSGLMAMKVTGPLYKIGFMTWWKVQGEGGGMSSEDNVYNIFVSLPTG